MCASLHVCRHISQSDDIIREERGIREGGAVENFVATEGSLK